MVLLLTIGGIAQAQESKFGLSLRGGAGRIEGDVRKSDLRPLGSGLIYYAPDPHFWIGVEGGYGEFITDRDAQVDSLVRLVPVALNLTFHFSPYKTVSPFASLGAGGIFWHNFKASDKETLYLDEQRQDSAPMVKTAGGLNFALSGNLLLTVGGDFSYFFNDRIDLNADGDEDDGLLSAFAGFTVRFGGGKPDLDHDGVFDRYDLDSKASEDRDGYMDHDGVPDTQMGANLLAMSGTQGGSGVDDIPPVVIHQPVKRATSGKDLRLRAEIFENRKLLKSAVLYRPYNVKRWLVEPMVTGDNEVFEAVIPGTVVPASGLEYCVVAVDEAISGIGYSGLPNRPNYVMVHGKETWWRVAAVAAGLGGWGTATYLMTREQK
ncbi:MAG: hypothetical protein ACREOO_05060 [bacterium]